MLHLNEIHIGFIGFGNMAQAIADGLLRQKTVRPDQIYVCAKNFDKLCLRAKTRGVQPCKDVAETVEKSDLLFIAVKPYMVSEVMRPVARKLSGKILISVAAGLTFSDYEEMLPETHHLSTLPNTPVAVAEGIFICEETHSLTEEEYDLTCRLLSSIALVQPVDGSHFSIAGTISGCGPAFASMFIEALGDAAVMHGLSRSVSYELAAQMLAGTGKLLTETGAHPGAMKDAVCSPGGTTIVGVTTLERKGFRSAVIDAVDAIERK